MDVSKLINKIILSSKGYPNNILGSKAGSVSFINPMQYCLARKNKTLYDDLDYVFVDGITVVKLLNLFYGIKVKRLSFDMTTMAKDLFRKLENTDKTIFFIGSQSGVVDKSIEIIKSCYPHLNIIGFRNGYFKDEAERELILEQICQLGPDYTIVGLGSIRQEAFVRDLKIKGYKGMAITCGGFLHQTANGMKYYPDWVDRYNIRAIYRIFKEKGMWKRLRYVLFWMPLYFLIDNYSTRKNIIRYGNKRIH